MLWQCLQVQPSIQAQHKPLSKLWGAGGQIFTAGPLCMEFSARMYEQSWVLSSRACQWTSRAGALPFAYAAVPETQPNV